MFRHSQDNRLTLPAFPISFTDVIVITGYCSGNITRCFIHPLGETRNAEFRGKLCCVSEVDPVTVPCDTEKPFLSSHCCLAASL